MNDNYYDDLGVEPTASREELREAHRQRIADLEAAREKKGVNEAQLEANRAETAKVRAAWNVLSDPFQRQRYDAQLAEESEPSGDVELVDDDQPASSGTELTGWRKLLAPPPPKDGAGARNGAGGDSSSNRRQRPEPTVALPAGMKLAEPKTRGMALLFDISILIVIFFSVSLVVPRLIQSDYQDIQDRISKTSDLKDARSSLSDAQKSLNQAKTASDQKSAQKDLTSAQKDYKSAVKDAKDAGVPARFLSTDVSNPSSLPTTKQLQTYGDAQSDKVRTTTLVTTGLTFALALSYLVPITVRKGYTFGMRGRRIRVVRVDGSPPGWYAATTRFALPILLALAIPSFGVILGLGMVAWGYFDRNGQGIHDKLARTLVVDA
jgi:curved DNA-binding protein CbpA